jgi:hypothetical protein
MIVNPVFEFRNSLSALQKASLFIQKSINSKKPVNGYEGLFEPVEESDSEN